jgi:hypothetical protein
MHTRILVRTHTQASYTLTFSTTQQTIAVILRLAKHTHAYLHMHEFNTCMNLHIYIYIYIHTYIQPYWLLYVPLCKVHTHTSYIDTRMNIQTLHVIQSTSSLHIILSTRYTHAYKYINTCAHRYNDNTSWCRIQYIHTHTHDSTHGRHAQLRNMHRCFHSACAQCIKSRMPELESWTSTCTNNSRDTRDIHTVMAL